LVLILIGMIAVVTFIKAVDIKPVASPQAPTPEPAVEAVADSAEGA
jgi:hypothetical protein